MSDEIEMEAKFPGKCIDCGYKFDAGTKIKFDTNARTAKHVECPQHDPNEQANIFDMWVKMAQEMEAKNERER